MRTFFQRSRVYRYQLTAQHILEAVQAERPQEEYNLEACKADLDSLVKWGNLTTLYDTGRVSTIADFRSPVLRYQATAEALEIEAFLESHEHIGASEGGLYQEDLPRLYALLTQLNQWLRAERHTFTPERRQEITEHWRQIFTTWGQITNDAAQYLGSIGQHEQQTLDLASYITYKNIVVNYIQSFAQQLVYHSNVIRLLLADWAETGRTTLLLEIVTSTPPPIQTLVENMDLWRADVQQQIEALTDWFAQESNIDLFLRSARDSMQKVVHRAHTLATAMKPQTDYVSMLFNLASRLQTIDDIETARLLYAASFACATPTHIAEGFTGTPSVKEASEFQSVWEQPATVTRTLRAIARGSNLERNNEPAMKHSFDMLNRIKQRHDDELTRQQQRFKQLFASALLDIGTLGIITPEQRMALTEIIDGCLSNPIHEYHLPDNSHVKLLNRNETQYVALRAQDGILFLPRYRLQRQVNG
jgi:uncharacterized protein (TIGR02677 family)